MVIIGAGYTGLSCAVALARAGRSVTVITLAELAQLPKNESALRSVART
jgi:glycine/D-amino acid oxidase-like deaminating enzyme